MKHYLIRITALVAVIVLTLSLTSCEKLGDSNMVFVEPKEYEDAFSNPMCGFRGGFMDQTDGYITTIRDYVPWNAIEKNADSTVQEIIDYTNEKWSSSSHAE